MKVSFLIGLLLLTQIYGCSSTTTITSSDKEAKIYVDSEMKGRGSVVHTDTKIIGSTTMVKITKDGCEDQSYTFSRNEELDVGALVGGCFVLVPFLWIQKYKPIHTYEFTCTPVKK